MLLKLCLDVLFPMQALRAIAITHQSPHVLQEATLCKQGAEGQMLCYKCGKQRDSRKPETYRREKYICHKVQVCVGFKWSPLTFRSPEFSPSAFAGQSAAHSHTLPSVKKSLVFQVPNSADQALCCQPIKEHTCILLCTYTQQSLNMPTKFSKVRKAVYQPFIYLIAAIYLFQCGTYEYFRCSVRKRFGLRQSVDPELSWRRSHCSL